MNHKCIASFRLSYVNARSLRAATIAISLPRSPRGFACVDDFEPLITHALITRERSDAIDRGNTRQTGTSMRLAEEIEFSLIVNTPINEKRKQLLPETESINR